MGALFESLTCGVCGGTMTKVSDAEAVCLNNECKRKLKGKLLSLAQILPFDSAVGTVFLAFYEGMDSPLEISAEEAKAALAGK